MGEVELSDIHMLITLFFADLSLAISEFSDTITALAESDLSMDLSQALQRLSGLTIREKEAQENQAKMDVVYLLNTADEYVRWIGSVRVGQMALTVHYGLTLPKVGLCIADKVILYLAADRSGCKEAQAAA